MSCVAERATRRIARGFTLIELMIVVAVVSILAAIAYPTYNDAVRKSRRGQAKTDLLELSQLAERYHTVNRTYVGFGNPSGDGTLQLNGWGNSPRSGTAYYTVKMTQATATSFVLEAQPVSGKGQENDALCKTMIINQAGAKSATGPDNAECW
jgi:type IV pilus assembly protein PilE